MASDFANELDYVGAGFNHPREESPSIERHLHLSGFARLDF